MASLSAINAYFGGLVHPSAAGDDVVAARHRSFIQSHLAGGILAFAALPLILLARGGVPSAIEITVLAWLIVPIFAAFDLSRTGRLERAHFISTASFAGLVLFAAAKSGGISSFALIWLPIIAFESAFSGSRRVVVASLGVAAFVIVSLLGLDAAGALNHPVHTQNGLAELSALVAVVYAAGLALRWDSVQTRLAAARSRDESRYRLLAENMSDLVTCHGPNGAVVFASPAAESLLGAAAADLQGRGLFERVHVGDRPAFLTALSQASQGGTRACEVRVRKAQPDAAPHFVWTEMRCRPLEGAPAGHVIAVIREISDRRAHEGHLEQARVEADRANEAKGKFLASMSHELRTPLNAIIGFSELLANEEFAKVDDKRRQEYAGLIHESGLHLLAVVNGILDMSRLDSGNFSIVAEPFPVAPVIDGCLQLFALKAEKASVQLSADLASDLPELMADKRACKQILINLLSNAIKFTPHGGEVRVSVHEEAAALRIEVADTGVGISAEDLPLLGNAFFQARSSYDRPYEGTGLGLSVVKGLVALHDGSFDVTSEVGRGTRVIIRLPRERAAPTTISISTPPPLQRERRVANG